MAIPADRHLVKHNRGLLRRRYRPKTPADVTGVLNGIDKRQVHFPVKYGRADLVFRRFDANLVGREDFARRLAVDAQNSRFRLVLQRPLLYFLPYRRFGYPLRFLGEAIDASFAVLEFDCLEKYYPGDDYVDVLGKSAYGMGLNFSEYDWAVKKKRNAGKVIWWSELGIRGRSDPPRDCMDVFRRLKDSYPELAGFVFWSDSGHYNVIGNENGAEFMACPGIITLE